MVEEGTTCADARGGVDSAIAGGRLVAMERKFTTHCPSDGIQALLASSDLNEVQREAERCSLPHHDAGPRAIAPRPAGGVLCVHRRFG